MALSGGHTEQELLERATHAQKSSYAPYSQFRVGAALLLSDGRVVEGCNFENASYGLAICAERNGVGTALSQTERDIDDAGFHIEAVAIVGKEGEPCWPCGACRQVLREFNCKTVIVDRGGEPFSIDFEEILPHSFGPDSL